MPLEGVLFLQLVRRLRQLGAVTASGQSVVTLPTLPRPLPPLLPPGGQAVEAALLVDDWSRRAAGGFSLSAAAVLPSTRLKHSGVPATNHII